MFHPVAYFKHVNPSVPHFWIHLKPQQVVFLPPGFIKIFPNVDKPSSVVSLMTISIKIKSFSSYNYFSLLLDLLKHGEVKKEVQENKINKMNKLLFQDDCDEDICDEFMNLNLKYLNFL